MRRLPSLVNLSALESLARTGSYRSAASDQDVTIACIAQRLTRLESEIGKTLLTQSADDARRFGLTPDGFALAEFLESWLNALHVMLPPECRAAKRTRVIRKKIQQAKGRDVSVPPRARSCQS